MDPMKQYPTAARAAKLLRISREQVFKLIRKGKLHRGPIAKINHRWHTTVKIDAKFNTQREARGLKPIFPELKQPPRLVLYGPEKEPFVPNLNPNLNLNLNPRLDPGPSQTVTTPAEPQPAFIVNARGYLATWHLQQPTLFLTANKAIFDFNGELELVDRVAAHVEKTADYVSGQISSAEDIGVRCTAILAAACILQLLLAAYYTLCHFNII